MEQELKTAVETKGQQLRGMLGIDSGGYLSNVAPQYQNKPVLEVTVNSKPKGSLYLRGFVGDIYQGGKWKASGKIQKESGKRKRGIWKGKYSQSQYTTFTGEENIEIKYTRLGKRSNYLYTPYSRSSAINEMSWGERKLCLGGEDDELSLYQDLADEMPYYESYSISSDLIMDVQNVLWRNANYSLSLDPIPRNQDYAEYFLFYSQKGYCEHFATAGTLLLRNMNHMARYVSGYRVSSDQFTYNKKDGTYTAKVLDSDAHAWSEVWVEKNYWMPQEMTPSSGDSSGSGAVWAITNVGNFQEGMEEPVQTETPSILETPEPSETELAEEPEETESPSPDPESELSQADLKGDGGSGPGSGSLAHWSIGKWWKSLSRQQQIFLVVNGVVVTVLMLVYLYFWGRKRRRIQRMDQVRESNRSAYIGMRLGVFLERLHHSGIAVGIAMPEQQWMQVLSEELREQAGLEEMETVAELIRRAAYSRELVTEAEADWFDKYCDKIEGSLTGKYPVFVNRIVKAVRK